MGRVRQILIRGEVAERLWILWDRGYAPEAIAEILGVDVTRVKQYLKNHGRKVRQRRWEHTTVRTLAPTEAAYIAGLVDGEGTLECRWIVVRGRKCPKPTVASSDALQIYNTDRALLEWVRDVVGTGSVTPDGRGVRRDGWNIGYVYRIASWRAAKLVAQLLPYLHSKRRQAELYLEFVQLRLQSSPHARHEPLRQNEIIQEMKQLRRGAQGRRRSAMKPENQQIIDRFLASLGVASSSQAIEGDAARHPTTAGT
jgi:hypothetical protein